MADLAVWQRTIVDPQGNVLPGAEVEVRHADTAELADIYLDREGEQAAPNPITANSDGFVRFYAPGGAYRVEASDGGLVAVWNFVAVGRLAESDVIKAEQFSSDAESHQEIRTKLDLVAASSEEMQAINAQVEAPEWAVAWADPEGNVAAGFDERGRFVARIGQQVEQFEVETGGQYVWGVTDEGGAVALGVDKEGNTAVSGLNLPGYDVRSVSASGIAFAIADEEGRAAFIVYDDGTTSAGSGGDPGPGPITHTVSWALVEPIDDASKELFVTWLTDSPDAKVLEYRPRGGQAWMAASSFRSRPFPELEEQWLHTVELRGLTPDTFYEVRVPGSDYQETIKTTPANGSTKVVMASDWQSTDYSAGSSLRLMGDVATSEEPDLYLFNGDHNNSDGEYTLYWAQEYSSLYKVFHDHWRGPDGALIPWVNALGNHEQSGRQIGMVEHIVSWAMGEHHESSPYPGVGTVRVGKIAAFVVVDTSNITPPEDQFDWYKGQLDEHSPKVSHSFVMSHFSPFALYPGHYTLDRVRELRRSFWPYAENYSGSNGSLRAFLSAHAHMMAASGKLKFDYNSEATEETNDNNFYRDPEGIYDIGQGMIGRPYVTPSTTDVSRVSNIDGQPFWDAILAKKDGEDDYVTYGNVQNPKYPAWNIWVLSLSADEWEAKCLNSDGQLMYEINEGAGD